jgi:uncharacterized protein YndB with AHSA1/START domain
MQHVEVSQYVPAPPDAVWARYTDHRSWTDWAKVGTVTLEREGMPAPNGVGCVRVISAGGTRSYEEVLAFEPPHRMTYTLRKGTAPLRDHLGEVIFTPEGAGTRVTWRCRFESRIPGLGPIMRFGISRLFATILRRLAAQSLA